MLIKQFFAHMFSLLVKGNWSNIMLSAATLTVGSSLCSLWSGCSICWKKFSQNCRYLSFRVTNCICTSASISFWPDHNNYSLNKHQREFPIKIIRHYNRSYLTQKQNRINYTATQPTLLGHKVSCAIKNVEMILQSSK